MTGSFLKHSTHTSCVVGRFGPLFLLIFICVAFLLLCVCVCVFQSSTAAMPQLWLQQALVNGTKAACSVVWLAGLDQQVQRHTPCFFPRATCGPCMIPLAVQLLGCTTVYTIQKQAQSPRQCVFVCFMTNEWSENGKVCFFTCVLCGRFWGW